MKVYIVMGSDDEYTWVEAVYTTRELAEQAQDGLTKTRPAVCFFVNERPILDK